VYFPRSAFATPTIKHERKGQSSPVGDSERFAAASIGSPESAGNVAEIEDCKRMATIYRESLDNSQSTRSQRSGIAWSRPASWLDKTPAVVLLFYGWTLCVAVNCYLTPNPYAARHSGQAGFQATTISERWFISPAWFLIVVSTIVVTATAKRWPRDPAIPLAVVLLWVSGLITEDLVASPKSYVFDTMMLLLCAIAAERDAAGRFFSSWQTLLLAGVISIMCSGALLSLCMPATFGHFGSYSRTDRGELTLWCAVGIRAFLAAFAAHGLFVAKGWYWKLAWALPWGAATLVSLMSYTRGGVISDIAGFALAVMLVRPAKTVVPILVLAAAAVTTASVQEFLLAGNDWNGFVQTEPRLVLWSSHLSAVASCPLWGVGNDALAHDFVVGDASTEIGMLAWASRYGGLYAIIMGYIVFRGLRSAKQLFLNSLHGVSTALRMDIVCPIILFTNLGVHILNGYSRILEYESFIYYYTLFYCYYRVRAASAQGLYSRAALRKEICVRQSIARGVWRETATHRRFREAR
jgi:hypothetical protein